jgi:hypothetical protein
LGAGDWRGELGAKDRHAPAERTASMAFRRPLPSSAMIPVTSVVLFKHGVGYFERHGSITGEAAVELSFRASEMNDVIRNIGAEFRVDPRRSIPHADLEPWSRRAALPETRASQLYRFTRYRRWGCSPEQRGHEQPGHELFPETRAALAAARQPGTDRIGPGRVRAASAASRAR